MVPAISSCFPPHDQNSQLLSGNEEDRGIKCTEEDLLFHIWVLEAFALILGYGEVKILVRMTARTPSNIGPAL